MTYMNYWSQSCLGHPVTKLEKEFPNLFQRQEIKETGKKNCYFQESFSLLHSFLQTSDWFILVSWPLKWVLLPICIWMFLLVITIVSIILSFCVFYYFYYWFATPFRLWKPVWKEQAKKWTEYSRLPSKSEFLPTRCGLS